MMYEIRVDGHLAADWSEWFDGLRIIHASEGETILAGLVRDQAALFGVLMKVRDLGLTLISVNRIASGETPRPVPEPPAA